MVQPADFHVEPVFLLGQLATSIKGTDMAEVRLPDENYIPPSESSAGHLPASSGSQWHVVTEVPRYDVVRETVVRSATAAQTKTNVHALTSGASIENQLSANFQLACGSLEKLRFNIWYLAVKRMVDVFIAASLLAVLSPALLLIVLLVRLDSHGPSLFVQYRVGRFGRTFAMFKFRTMVTGQPLLLDMPVHKIEGDPRVTRVGRILRTTSLDELPQLLNVLRGDMSLVGPRPEIAEIVLKYYEPWQYRRFLVPQGMTGWWQINGRGTRLMREHTDDDVHYVDHASIWLDLKILLLTVRAVVRREGAF